MGANILIPWCFALPSQAWDPGIMQTVALYLSTAELEGRPLVVNHGQERNWEALYL